MLRKPIATCDEGPTGNPCCGILEHGNFQAAYDGDFEDGNYSWSCPTTLRANIRNNLGLFQICGTIANTPKECIEVLKAHRFEKVSRFRNPNSGNIVTVWIRRPRKSRTRRKER